MEATKNTGKTKTIIYWIINILLPVLVVVLIPTNDTITMQIKLYIAVTLFAILTFIFENFNRTAIALLLPIVYVILVGCDASDVFSSWTGSIPWYMIGGLLLAVILDRIGLLKRIAYNVILLTGATYKGIILGIAIVGIILYLFIPGNTVFPMAALSFGICKALDLKPGKASGGIMITAAVFSLSLQCMFYSSSYGILENLAASITGDVGLSWIDFPLYNLPQLGYLALLVLGIFLFFKPEVKIDGKEYFRGELQKMGKITVAEIKAIVVLILLFAGVLTVNWHGINAMWLFAIAPIALYIPGVNVGTEEDVKNVNWSMIIFATGCMSIGTTAAGLGIGTIIKDALLPYLEDKNIIMIFFIAFILIFVLNLLLTPNAIQSVLTVPMVEIFMSLGVSVPVTYFFMLNALDQIILPYQIPLYLIFFSFGMIRLKDFIKYFSYKSVVNLVWMLIVMIAYWKLIGIFWA